VVVGDYNGHVGLGVKCAKEVSSRDAELVAVTAHVQQGKHISVLSIHEMVRLGLAGSDGAVPGFHLSTALIAATQRFVLCCHCLVSRPEKMPKCSVNLTGYIYLAQGEPV
jgi:hypothetical protein